MELDEVDITGIDEHPPDASVKLYGPPGTGKTTQSAARVGCLLRDYDYGIGDVAWSTYRRSLARETLGRLSKWGVIDSRQLENPSDGATRYISTIHAVAYRCSGISQEPVGYGEKKQFADMMNMQFESESPWDEPVGQLLFDTFSYMKNNLLDPTKRSDINKCPKADDLRSKWNGSIPDAWEKWEDFKRKKGKIDFYEMLEAPIRQDVRPERDILVVDEYHDATPIMAKLTEFWMEDMDTVIVAGDPNQVVNNFEGADPEHFERIDLPQVLLDKTYRVPYEHWGVARSVLSNAHDPPEVERNSHGKFAVEHSPTFMYDDEREKWKVPNSDQKKSPGWFVDRYGEDTMFLTRTKKQVDGIARALEKAGIIYDTQRNVNIGWGTGEKGVSTRTALYNALQKMEGFRRGDFGGSGLSNFSEGGRDPELVSLSPEETAALFRHTNHKYLEQSRGETEDLADRILQDEEAWTLLDVDMYVTDDFWGVYTRGKASVTDLNKGNMNDRDVEALKRALKRNDHPINEIRTIIYTIHASKGAEANTVVVYDGVTGRIDREMRRKEDTRKNEWRTWYVALTRSSENLFVLRGGFDWTQPFLPANMLDMARAGRDEAAATDGGGR